MRHTVSWYCHCGNTYSLAGSVLLSWGMCVISCPLVGDLHHLLCVGMITPQRDKEQGEKKSPQLSFPLSKKIYRTIMFMRRLLIIILLTYELKE